MCFYFINQACSRRRNQRTQGDMPPKFFVVYVFLFLQTRYPKQNTMLLLKSNICPPFCAPTNFPRAPWNTRKVFVGVQKQYWWNVNMGARRKFSRGVKVDNLHPFQVADDAMQMNVHKTLYAFYTTKEMHQVTATASKMRFVHSNASFSLTHVKLPATNSHCLAALPPAAMHICV